MRPLNKEIEQFAFEHGADEVAFADLSQASAYLQNEYGDKWQAFTRAVVIAVHFPQAIVQELLKGPSHTYLAYYDILNNKINEIGLLLANKLSKKGYTSYPIPASQRISDNKLAAVFSHRFAAYLGGLGWVGKSCNIVTEKNGPRLRLGTVLTNAPLDCGKPVENLCKDCRLCMEICPAHAIKDHLWQENQSICQHIDALACHNYLMEIRQSFGKRVCGLCLAACPYSIK
ncbi:MAG: 4Fe-4S binding protein [Bacillota bacterium]|jgi:epoxyqueuosine reductase